MVFLAVLIALEFYKDTCSTLSLKLP